MKFILFFFISVTITAQTDYLRWEKKNSDYRKKAIIVEVESNNKNDFFSFILSNSQKVYKTVISDVDGENCPFYPSCSTFYVESVQTGGIIKGTLMFFDRFTRDLNIFRDRSIYYELPNGKLFDPISNYLLKPDKIKLKFKD
ncbi:MAG TPA: membrane protein insertion efficiency factor YidD [Melioribacteraceae bacterium]|nr:membrane protein insertion efficiency factor YidD [Melioribacteraceae bacterium]